jgi:hypothetical protein
MRKSIVSIGVFLVSILSLNAVCLPQAHGAAGNSMDNAYRHVPISELASIVKFAGCTLDGLLNSYSGIETGSNEITGRLTLFDNYVDLLSRSHCIYVNRAVETWDTPPDFSAIEANMTALLRHSRRSYVFGVFVAESVSLTKTYYYPDESRNFNFREMCESTPEPAASHCIASFEQAEYQKYVAYIAQKSIDLGFQVFLFGAAGLTDSKSTATTSGLLKVVRKIKSYAAKNNVSALFIAQDPSTFGGRAYIDSFDLVQGGAYIDADGSLPNALIVTNKGSGSAHAPPRLWLVKDPEGKPFYDPQRLVFEYDWFGDPADDSSEVACLSVKSPTYLNTVRGVSPGNCPEGHVVGSALPAMQKAYDFFKGMGAGFWLPGRQPIAFPPWVYTPLNLDLYKRDSRFEVNFNDEGILSIPAMKEYAR